MEWAAEVILAIFSAISLWLGFYVKRLVFSIDKLGYDVKDLTHTIARINTEVEVAKWRIDALEREHSKKEQ